MSLVPQLTIDLMVCAKMVMRLAPREMAKDVGIPLDDLATPEERQEILADLATRLIDLSVLCVSEGLAIQAKTGKVFTLPGSSSLTVYIKDGHPKEGG